MTIKRMVFGFGVSLMVAGTSFAPAMAADATDGARIRELVDTGMHYYWSGGDIKKAEAEVFKGITLHGRYDVVEQAFTEASKLAPERIDLRYAIASARILQKKLDESAETYIGITRVDPHAFDAYTWLAALAHIRGEDDQYRNYMDAMAGIDRDKAATDIKQKISILRAAIEADALLGGAIKFEGEMLDPPMFGKALQTLLRANALQALNPEDRQFAMEVLQMMPAQVIRENWPYGAIL